MAFIMQYLPNLLLVFCRITSFFVVTPIFSAKNVPTTFKVGLSIFITLITFDTINKTVIVMDGTFLLDVIKEIVIGLLLGFVAYLFFSIVQISGAFLDLQMGFSLANIIDPMTGAQSPMIGNLKFMLATLLFLSFNGHYYFLRAIMDSYKWVPLSNQAFIHVYNGQVSDFLIKTFSTVFSLSFQMAIPLVAALFLTDVGLGILTRVAPQFNIFVIGLPLKILIGFIMLILLFPITMPFYANMFSAMFRSMQQLIQLLSG